MKQALLTIVTKQPENDETITFTTRTEYDITDDGVKFDYEETLGEDISNFIELEKIVKE